MTKAEWSLINRFKTSCMTSAPACKELYSRTGRMDISIECKDMQSFLSNEGSQRVKCYLLDSETKTKTPVLVPFNDLMLKLVKSIPVECEEISFNITQAFDYDYDLICVINEPIVMIFNGVCRFILNLGTKKYLYPSQSLLISQIPDNIKIYVSKIYERYSRKESVILNIYMLNDVPCIKVFSRTGVLSFNGELYSAKYRISGAYGLPSTWIDYIDKIIELYSKNKIYIKQVFLVLSKTFKGKESIHREHNNEDTIIFY